MRCETFLERYDALEPGAEPGPGMSRHLASCGRCRGQVGAVEAALGELRAADAAGSPGGGLLEERIMAAARLVPGPRRDFSVRDWIIAGAVIAVSMILIPVGDYFARFDEFFGARYTLPLSLVLGCVLTAYGALFAGAHLGELQAFMERHARRS